MRVPKGPVEGPKENPYGHESYRVLLNKSTSGIEFYHVYEEKEEE